MVNIGPIRSALFVPGTRLDRVEKALATNADVVIIDLEDAVPPHKKDEAREGVSRLLADTRQKNLMVRTNGLETEYFVDDAAVVAGAGLLSIIVPKVESAEDVTAIHAALTDAEHAKGAESGSLPLIALIESAAGVDNISSVAKVKTSPARLYTFALGAADYTLDLGIEMTPGGNELLYARSRLPIACRAAGLEPPLDTPFMLDLKDAAALEVDARRSKQLGFQGKLCIHPNQVEVVNRVFSPTSKEIEQANKIVQAFEDAESRGQGALQIDGKFVDYPVVVRARRVLEIAAALATR